MPNQNIFQQRIRPVLPRILQNERVFVYVPKATTNSPGIASFESSDFTVANGEVTLKWPMSLQIENNNVNDPLETMARVKLNSDEFVHTNTLTTITHPLTGVEYKNTKANLKFKRTGQNLFNKPGFMMVNNNDFESEEIDSGDTQDLGRYVRYKLKRNNPLEQASLVKLNSEDFSYTNNEATIRWPYAHDPTSGTNRTNQYGLVKIRVNSEGYLKFNDGYLDLDYTKLKEDTDIIPTYGGKNEGFNDYDNFVTPEGEAVRDDKGRILLKLTKDAIGLSKVVNKSFEEYIYEDFGEEMQQYFTEEFFKKLDKITWNNLFSDWKEPAGTTVEKVFGDLRAEDESIRDAMRTNRAFLGFFEDEYDLENTYKAGEWTFGSTAYVKSTKSYWRVRATNVNKVIEGRVPVKADVPDDAKDKTTYRVGRRDTNEVYQWDGAKFVLTDSMLDWVDAIVMNEEDIQPYIEGHASEHFFTGFKLGCRETGAVIQFNGNEWVSSGTLTYEWADAYITTLAWNTFIETDPTVLKPNGIANVGTSGKWVSSDHVHPTDETRLAKTIFDATNLTVYSRFNNNSLEDFKFAFTDGGDKQMNIPYVRLTKSIYNWNGHDTFVDSEDSENYYWSGTKEEYEAQADSIKNQTMIYVDDGEDFIAQDLLQKQDLDEAGITIYPGHSNERFVIIKTDEVESLISAPVTLEEETSVSGQKRYVLKPIVPETTSSDTELVVTTMSARSTASTTYDTYKSTNTSSQTILGLTPDGKIIQTVEEEYLKIASSLDNKQLVIAKGNGRTVESLRSIDFVEGGIIVADGTGAIKSTSFTKPGKLLQTAGESGELLAAEIDVETLVRSESEEFNQNGIIISTGEGKIKRQELGDVENQLLVTDGNNGLKVQSIENESLVYIDNTGKVKAFPITTNDAGKVLTVQSNGKFAVQNLPSMPTHLPITTISENTITSTKLSFGETSIFEEGVLYLW